MKPANQVHAGHILLALARYFNWFQNTMMPECWIDGGQADLVFVSRAGYVTEIEIKVSFSDWNSDCEKDKWKRERPHVARFYYAVPETLSERVPAWLPDGAGILSVSLGRHGRPTITPIREARRMKAAKITPEEIRHMHQRCYFRYWRSELSRCASEQARMFKP